MSAVRESFVRRFSEADAAAIEAAAAGHRDDMLDGAEHGDDPFADCIAVCIGWECVGRFRDDHGITATADAIRAWCVEERVLDRVIGPIDYLAVLTGAYTEWLPEDQRPEVGA